MAHDADLLVEVATRFYVDGDTQEQIAHDLNVHGSTVSRALKQARLEGIVQVEIVRPAHQSTEMASRLCEVYQISRAVVVDEEGDGIRSLGQAAAVQIQALIGNGTRIGLAWGSTLYEAVRAFKPSSARDIQVTQLIGGVGLAAPGVQAHELIRIVISKYAGATPHYLMAPAIVAAPRIRDTMLEDVSIRASLDLARQSSVAVVGIGTLDETAPLIAYSHITHLERQRLIDSGAVGEMCADFFDSEGHRVPDGLEARTIAVGLVDLVAMPIVLAVAGGIGKAAAIQGACRTGAVDVLVTDSATAREVLRLEDDARERSSGLKTKS
jgi:deoxyribonucleoside regulator